MPSMQIFSVNDSDFKTALQIASNTFIGGSIGYLGTMAFTTINPLLGLAFGAFQGLIKMITQLALARFALSRPAEITIKLFVNCILTPCTAYGLLYAAGSAIAFETVFTICMASFSAAVILFASLAAIITVCAVAFTAITTLLRISVDAFSFSSRELINQLILSG